MGQGQLKSFSIAPDILYPVNLYLDFKKRYAARHYEKSFFQTFQKLAFATPEVNVTPWRLVP
ncbi:MAG: hypothetical protein IIC13_10875 [SAR324 cluster bacterium]|nr:hypothetical protein [SAR324 cluster bacterium]